MSDIYLTPRPIIDALGPFDLDPCAAPEPRPWPTAEKHITLPEDGLAAGWSGFIWLNPPYGDRAQLWTERLAQHAEGGIALLMARTETPWFFRTVWDKYAGALFMKDRIWFHLPDGSISKGNCGAPPVLIAYRDEALRRLARCRIPGHLVVNAAIIILRGRHAVSWRQVINAAMSGRQVRLRDLYDVVRSSDKGMEAVRSGVKWREKVRKVLQAHFRPVARGVWAPA